MLPVLVLPMTVKLGTVFSGTFLGAITAFQATGAQTDPTAAIIGAIAGAVGSLAMLIVWARLVGRSQATQVRTLIAQLADERRENERLRDRVTEERERVVTEIDRFRDRLKQNE